MTELGDFKQLYNDNVKLVRKIVSSFGYRNADADDLAQQAFVTAWEKMDKLKDASKFTPWLCSITRNLCLMEKRKTRKTVSVSSTDSIDEENGAEVTLWFDPEEKVAELEVEKNLLFLGRLLDKYTKEPRGSIARMYYRDGLNTREISDKTSLPQNTILSHLSRFRIEIKSNVLKHCIQTN